jgi:hypothetical protein
VSENTLPVKPGKKGSSYYSVSSKLLILLLVRDLSRSAASGVTDTADCQKLALFAVARVFEKLSDKNVAYSTPRVNLLDSWGNYI